MKSIYKSVILLLSVLLVPGCGLDNYKEPDLLLTGSVTYKGNNIQVRHASITLDIEQDSYELNDKIEVFVDKDGNFSSLLFPGTYRLVPKPGNGPWTTVQPSIEFTMDGNKHINLEVVPYYILKSAAIELKGSSLNGSCEVESVSGEKEIESVTIYIGKTVFVDDRGGHNIALQDFESPVVGKNDISLDISKELQANSILYARIGMKIKGVDERMFSETVRIK